MADRAVHRVAAQPPGRLASLRGQHDAAVRFRGRSRAAMPLAAIVFTAFVIGAGSAAALLPLAAAAVGAAAVAAAAAAEPLPLAVAAAGLNGQRATLSVSGVGSAQPPLSSSRAFGPSPSHSRSAAVTCMCE